MKCSLGQQEARLDPALEPHHCKSLQSIQHGEIDPRLEYQSEEVVEGKEILNIP